jgi:hypothetical protein
MYKDYWCGLGQVMGLDIACILYKDYWLGLGQVMSMNV